MKEKKKSESDNFNDVEAQARFESALRGALNTPHKPLKEKPKAKKVTKNTKGKPK
ncbi:MAG: hypothetical protein Q7T45_11410 [Bradyrhizobium sp.]|uniref:hypothetical protein n=1 Tax=Bradyrhizobium sp. TaxID=376 RepID=UPI00272327A4|nr:hypothetical protein [Bradyrhizobium sp.]MDO8398414.1 hypothetical protein [Bradyrhizobium sp.]